MDILTTEAPACNAVGLPSTVRTEPDAINSSDTFIVGEFTEWKFDAFLEAHPQRKASYLTESPKEQARYRERVARLWALRDSPMPAELHAAVTLADRLQDMLLSIVEKYGKAEGRRVLEAAGLRIPGPNDLSFSWGGDHFAHSYRGARKLLAELEDFSEVVWACLFLMLPGNVEEPLVREAA